MRCETQGKAFLSESDTLISQCILFAKSGGLLIQTCRTDTGNGRQLICSSISSAGYVSTYERLNVPESLRLDGLLRDGRMLESSTATQSIGDSFFVFSEIESKRRLSFSPCRLSQEEALLQYFDRWLLVTQRSGLSDPHCLATLSYFRSELLPAICTIWSNNANSSPEDQRG